MKSLIVYSSRTGNTKMIAEAIHTVMPEGCDIYPVESAPAPDQYDFISLGFWVDKGGPDSKMAEYMEQVSGKQVGLFATLGAYPDSDHAKKSLEKAKEKIPGNTVHGTFICQGKIDPKILAAMAKMAEANQAHPVTPERTARIEEAKKHPNEDDCLAAQEAFRHIISKVAAA